MFETILTGATLAMLLLEGIKWLVRRWKPEYEFPVKFYLIALPVLEYATLPLLVIIGVTAGPIIFDWKLLVQILVSSLASVFVYNGTVAPLKAYNEERNG